MNRRVFAILACLLTASAFAAAPPKPALLLYYTHDAQGYLASCGCSGPVLGLADLVGDLQARRKQAGVPTLTLEGGNLSSDQRRGRIVWDALVRGQYDAVAFGPSDLGWQHEYWPMVQPNQLPVILGGWFQPNNNLARGIAVSRWTKQLGQLTVGVTSTGPRTDVVAAAMQATHTELKALRKVADVVVLFSYHDLSIDRGLVQHGLLADADLIIGCHGAEILEQPEQVERTWFLPAAPQGRRYGQVSLSTAPADEATAKTGRRKSLSLTFESLTPPQRARADDPLVKDTQAEYRREQRLTLAKGVEADLDAMAYGHVPSDRCAVCHRQEYLAWGRSQHAHALRTLLTKDAIRPECLPCHYQAWRETMKFFTPATPERGVECVSCHGNGLEHLFISRRDTIGHGDLKVCLDCHTQAHDPGWEAAKRWEAIKH